MLTSTLKVLVKNSDKESFYGKKKIVINILIAFFHFIKVVLKFFLIELLINTLRALISISL